MTKLTLRDKRVIAGYNNDVTQSEVAESLGVTRQRVQQIERRLGLKPRRVPGVHKTYNYKCAECKKPCESRLKGRKFCSRECFFKSREVVRSATEQAKVDRLRKERNRVRSREYYHKVFKKRPDWRTVVKDRNKKYARKLG